MEGAPPPRYQYTGSSLSHIQATRRHELRKSRPTHTYASIGERLRREHGIVTVYLCPTDGPAVRGTTEAIRIRVAEEHTFADVLQQACQFFRITPDARDNERWMLKDAHGAHWPPAAYVLAEFRGDMETVVRLCLEEIEAPPPPPTPPPPPPPVAKDDSAVRLQRPASRKDVTVQVSFLSMLILLAYFTTPTVPLFEMHGAVWGALDGAQAAWPVASVPGPAAATRWHPDGSARPAPRAPRTLDPEGLQRVDWVYEGHGEYDDLPASLPAVQSSEQLYGRFFPCMAPRDWRSFLASKQSEFPGTPDYPPSDYCDNDAWEIDNDWRREVQPGRFPFQKIITRKQVIGYLRALFPTTLFFGSTDTAGSVSGHNRLVGRSTLAVRTP